MPTIYQPGNGADYESAGQRAFQFFRRHSNDAYSSPTLMQMAAQCVNGTAPSVLIDETQTRIDRLTETKQGGVRSAAVVLNDGRVLLATRERYRRSGLGRDMLAHLQSYQPGDVTLQFWVASRNLDALRFLYGNGLELIASTTTSQCFGFQVFDDEDRTWPR